MMKREVYFKKIGELTQKEFEELFNIPTDITDPNFRKILEPIAEHSIFDINVQDYKINELSFNTAYLLGVIQVLKTKIPQTHIIALFGEPGCGKSHLIHLLSQLKEMDLSEIKKEDRVALGYGAEEYEKDEEIKSYKELADSITIIQKKTTRPSRDGKGNKPEIEEGLPIEEVEKCDWTYTMGGNLYGISKKEMDEALQKGNVMVIVNDPELEVMKHLKEAYPSRLIATQVYRTTNEKEWIRLMKEDKRSDEEIEKRKKKFGASIKMYKESWHLGIPEVIFNLPQEKMLNKHLLMQLKGILKRREERIEGNLEAKKEEELGK